MSSDNPYSPPTTPGKLIEEPLESYGPRTYQRLIGQSRPPVIILAVLAGGLSGLFFVQFLSDLRLIVDILSDEESISAINPIFATYAVWRLASGAIFLWITLGLLAVARAMRHLSRLPSTNLARLLLAENRFWWTAAVALVIFLFSYAALFVYGEWAP